MKSISAIPRAVHFVHLKAALICPYMSVYIYHIPICKFFELSFPIRNFPLKGRLTGRDLEFSSAPWFVFVRERELTLPLLTRSCQHLEGPPNWSWFQELPQLALKKSGSRHDY